MVLERVYLVFRRYPVVPSMITYSFLYPGANYVQQRYFRNHRPGENLIDWKEVTRFCVYGGLIHAPLVYNWLKFAAHLFPKTTVSHLLAKVALDQSCFAPVALSTFYIGLSTLEGKDKDGIYEEWRQKFPNTWACSAFIWPFLQTINFRFVPGGLRPIFVAVCSFFWTTMLAAWKHTNPTINLDFLSNLRKQ
eukprot:TRINITY_DN15191_c0_g3_i1.p1 TRINITY_DN15191_c0_g3~~TRINITY_DN15191_c0_g3_i1.p1  ORF type:complete len:192 (-),score=20.36 TRINITY_DN15191_c0_g3_i1:158-733(-)